LTGAKDAKDFVLFQSGGHSKVVYARDLADYNFNEVLADRNKSFRRSTFRGELLFTSAIFALSYPHPHKVYFLTGHGERSACTLPTGEGYSSLAGILTNELDCVCQECALTGTNSVPTECQLLIIAGPRMAAFSATELGKVDDYLTQAQGGRRLLVLLDSEYSSGIETILAKWGVDASTNRVTERDKRFVNGDGSDFLTAKLSSHPILKAINAEGLGIRILSPRFFEIKNKPATPGAPDVKVLAASSDEATDGRQMGCFALMVAIEQGIIKGASAPGGGTRIAAIGDTDLFCDKVIDDSAANHVFAASLLNWLLDRPEVLLANLGPRPIHEYKLLLTRGQMSSVKLLFLAGIPGAVLFTGWLVWLKRRQ
jgi:hypothetical protein